MAPESTKMCMLDISVEFQGLVKDVGWPEEHKKPGIAAYVFSSGSRPVAKEPLKMEGPLPSSGNVKIELKAIRGYYTVKIGPDTDDIGRILKSGEFPVQKVSGAPGKKKVDFAIPKPVWWCWIRTPYVVTGTVEKDGAPICVGEVDIYDVDIWYCLRRLPPYVIERVRDAFIDVIYDPPPIRIGEIPPDRLTWFDDWDDDWCGTPPPKPKPPFTRLARSVDIEEKLDALPPEWAFARRRFDRLPDARKVMDVELAKMPLEKKRAFLAEEAVEGVKVSQILYSNTDQFRNLLKEYFQAFRFWLCWYPWIYWIWWPWCRWYSLEYLGTAELQSDGSFTATLWLSICREDIPDLWFRVKQEIGGAEKVIYARYPIPCHTYWNHPSGVPVHLMVTHPEAVSCFGGPGLDPEDLWIAPLDVGEYELLRIYGTGAGNDPVKIGLYESIGSGYQDGPFGGTIGLRIWFSPKLLDAGAEYYRIKYRSNGTGPWTALNDEITWYYVNPSPPPIFEKYPLGPDDPENPFFKIPPDYNWVKIGHMVHGYLNTSEVPNGFVEFKVEIYDGSKNRLNPASFPIAWKLRDDLNDPTSYVDAATINPALVGSDPEDPGFETFVFKLRIDNRPCDATIDAPTISGVTADPNCGMLEYGVGDNVYVVFHANHPATYEPSNFSFARFKFEMKRGNNRVTNAPPPDQEDPAVGEITLASVGVYTGDGNGNFDNSFLVNHLLEGCTVAAFAESLHVWAKAFNGWRRLSEYDDYNFRAFGLKPKP